MKIDLGKSFIRDFLAGLTVSFAAISLGAVFGALTPKGAFAGMVSASIIPIITSILGGTRLQSSGPTGPMTAVAAILIAFAYDSFGQNTALANQFITLSLLLTAVFLFLAGILRLGKYVSKIPQIVVIGFMNAIALIIFLDQFNRIFGLAGKTPLEGNLLVNFGLALATFIFILQTKKILILIRIPSNIANYLPGVLISIMVFTGFQYLLGLKVETVDLGVEIQSFSDYLSLIGGYFPTAEVFQLEILSKALTFAIELSLLAYFDSLLTSLVVDKITGEQTNKDKELFAQGLANAVSGVLGGLPGAQATVNSVLLIKEGAVTRFAGILVGIFVFLGIILFKDLIGLIAMAIFSGILIKIAWDIAEKEFFKLYIKKKWYFQAAHNWQLAIIIYTMAVTVLVDLNIAVITSVIIFYAIKLKRYYFGLFGISMGLLLIGLPLKSLNASIDSLNLNYLGLWAIITVIYTAVFLHLQRKGQSIQDIDYTGLHLKEYSPS